MATSTILGWTIPTETSDPWYVAFLALINEIDAAVAPQRATMQFWSTSTVVATGTVYLGRGDSTGVQNVRFICPFTGFITSMSSVASLFAGASGTWVYTLNIDGTDKAMTMTVGPGTGGSAFKATATGAIAVSAGQEIAIKLVTNTSNVAFHTVVVGIRVTA